MLKRRLKNPIFLIYVLVTYVALQFSWWLYLIHSLYAEIYKDNELLSHKTWMLLGEGSVFIVILLFGIIIILRAFKQERELTKQQENFLLSVTHELKTPISSVKLYLQTLKKRTLNADKKEEIYDRSLQDINRLDSLVNNLLITRNIENNNFFFEKKKIQIDQFITDKVDALKPSILKAHDISLSLNPIQHEMDPLALESILTNLLENAAKYSPEGSSILVSTENEQGFWILTVTDQGIGIKKEKRTRVFSKFYREENEMTRHSKGTGLGLYIVNYFVRRHNGKISLHQNKPNGLIVKITFKK